MRPPAPPMRPVLRLFAGALFCGGLALLGGCTGYGPSRGEDLRQLFRGGRADRALNQLLSPDADERKWAILALARAGDLGAVKPIGLMLNPEQERVALVRATAAVGLRMLGDKRGLPYLRRAAADPEPVVRADVVRCLGSLGGPEDLPLIALRLSAHDEPDPAVRLQAAEALRRLGSQQAAPDLVVALRDADPSVAFAAHAALVSLTGQDLPFDPRKWEDWLRSQTSKPQT